MRDFRETPQPDDERVGHVNWSRVFDRVFDAALVLALLLLACEAFSAEAPRSLNVCAAANATATSGELHSCSGAVLTAADAIPAGSFVECLGMDELGAENWGYVALSLASSANKWCWDPATSYEGAFDTFGYVPPTEDPEDPEEPSDEPVGYLVPALDAAGGLKVGAAIGLLWALAFILRLARRAISI